MSKSTIRLFRKKAVFRWQQDIDKFNVTPVSWGFCTIDKWLFFQAFRTYWVMYWNPEPGPVIMVDGVKYENDPDMIYLFPPHTPYSAEADKPFIQFAVHFFADAPFDRVVSKMFRLPAKDIVKLIMTFSDQENKIHNSIVLKQIILHALSMIPADAFDSETKTIDSRISKVLNYVDKNPTMNHTVKSLSALVKMSENNFHRYFVAGTATTPKQYVIKRKMEYAIYQLIHTKKTIDEVAQETGFTDRYHFSKIFKQYFAYPPVTLRKKILQEAETAK